MSNQQNSLMKLDPAFGTEVPYPSHADQYRKWHGGVAWLYNPWTGEKRHPLDIGSDVTGLLIIPPDEPIYGCCNWKNKAELLAEDIEAFHMNLDDRGISRKDESGNSYSMWGRVVQLLKAQFLSSYSASSSQVEELK